MEMRLQYEDDIAKVYEASQSGCVSTLNALIYKDPLILNKLSLSTLSETPLHLSALLGHLGFTQVLVTLKPSLATELDAFKRTPLHLASAEGNTDIVKELLKANHHVCGPRDHEGRIPLHYAVMRGRVEVVEKLVDKSPESTLVLLDGGETVLHLCVKYNQLECLKLLVQSQSDNAEFLTSKDTVAGNTVLHLATMLKQIEIIVHCAGHKILAFSTKSEGSHLSKKRVREARNALNHNGFTALNVIEYCPSDFKSIEIRHCLLEAGVERTTNVQKDPPISLPIAAINIDHDHESSLIVQPKLWYKWMNVLLFLTMKFKNYFKDPAAEEKQKKDDFLEERNNALMVVASLTATVSFQAATNPPGGVWQETFTNPTKGIHCSQQKICAAGTSVSADHWKYGFVVFMIFNSLTFAASLSAIVCIISGFSLKNSHWMKMLTFSMYVTLTFLASTYIYAVEMVTPDWVISKNFRGHDTVVLVWLPFVSFCVGVSIFRAILWFLGKLRS